MKLNVIVIVILGFSILFVTNQAYAPCIEGPGINCNNYPPPALTQINADKLNYETTDKPAITIIGVPYAVAHLEIDDPSSNIIFTHDINLSSNGTVRYVLDISSYKPGVYSAIATSLISKLTTSFAVGLATTGDQIMLNTDKNSYLPGDNVTILGAWNPNTLVQLSLIDPSGMSVKSIQTFSDKTGHFSSFDFSIPLIATHGTWKIDGISRVNHVSVNITVDKIPGVQLNKAIMLSPLKQFKSGIAAKDVKCKQGLELLMKSHDNMPACVKSTSIQRLIGQGWINPYNFNGEYIGKEISNAVSHDITGNYTTHNIIRDNQTSSTSKLFLSVDQTYANPAQAVVIDISLNNTGTTPLVLVKSDNWPRSDLRSGLCSNLPLGIAILKGYYTEQNMTGVKSLVIYPLVPCPMPSSIKSYTIQPLSSKATQECDSLFSCHELTDMSVHLTIPDFIDNAGQHHIFDIGQYTIVGGDEWGHIAIQHFTEEYATAYSNPIGK